MSRISVEPFRDVLSLASSAARKSSVCREDFTFTKDMKRLLALSLLGNS